MLRNKFYPESAYGGFADIDTIIAFYNRVNALIQPSFTVIDFGCGRGELSENESVYKQKLVNLRGKVQRVIGLDVDEAGRNNPMIDEFNLLPADSNTWPIPERAIDLIVSAWALEHVERPEATLAEAARVLKPGGYLCLMTSNLLNYVGIAAKLIPNRLHSKVLGFAKQGRKVEDIFPTRHRCNTTFQLRKQLRSAGFESVVYGYEDAPSYLNFSKSLYALGVAHQKFAPNTIKGSLFAFGRRRS